MKTFPAHGLYVRHAQRIAAVDCSFVTETPDARPAILFDNQSSGFVSGLRSQHAPDQAVVARNGGMVKAVDTGQHSRWPSPARSAMRRVGKECGGPCRARMNE